MAEPSEYEKEEVQTNESRTQEVSYHNSKKKKNSSNTGVSMP